MLTFEGLQTSNVGQTHDSLRVSGPYPAGFSSELNISEALLECKMVTQRGFKIQEPIMVKAAGSILLHIQCKLNHILYTYILVHMLPKP